MLCFFSSFLWLLGGAKLTPLRVGFDDRLESEMKYYDYYPPIYYYNDPSYSQYQEYFYPFSYYVVERKKEIPYLGFNPKVMDLSEVFFYLLLPLIIYYFYSRMVKRKNLKINNSEN